jgi:hypothetical protein
MDKRYRETPACLDRFIKMANVEIDKRALIRGYPSLEKPLRKTFEWILEDIERSHQRTQQQIQAETAAAAECLKGTVVYVPGDSWQTLQLYGFAREIRATLIKIVQAVRTGHELESVEMPRVSAYHVAQIGPHNTAIVVKPNDSWESRLYDDFIKALNGFDANRFRQCSCGRIFRAVRTGQKWCSGNCRTRAWCEQNPVRWAKIQNDYERKRAVR